MADALTAALNAGVSLDAIEKMLTVDGFSSEEIAKAAESIAARNASQHDAVDVDGILAELRKIQPNTQIDWSDLALSRLFADIFRERCRYCSTAKEWFVFDGVVWKIDVGGMTVLQFAKTFVDALTLFCLDAPSERQKSDGLKFASRYAQLRYRENLIRDARDVNYFTSDELDRDGDLLNCRNGTLNLRTGAFTMHKPGDLLSKCCGAVYDPDARSEDFERFFTEIMCGDAEKARYLQKILGYALTTDTSLETCWILYGATTRNGKSTLVETIAHTLGDYARTMQPQTLAQQKNRDTRQASGDIARLAGCRFLNASEPPKRMLFDTALLKTLLGRDTITARHLYEREFEFRPCFKLVINTNYLPVVTDDTLFTSGRLNVVSFDRHFEPDEQDRTLKTRLQSPENVSGILNWLLDGLRMYREEGAKPPECVRAATDEYRRASDKIGLFVSECLEQTGKNSAAGAIYEAYSQWCADGGFGVESKRSFFEELTSRGLFGNTGTVNGRTIRNVVRGFELADVAKPDFSNELPL